MESKGKIAKMLFLQGYNCTQAVVGAFAEELGFDFDTAMRVASPFGGGMGRMREVCGTVSGMLMVLGMKYGYDDPKAREEKKALYERVQNLADRFKEENGSIICRELLGLAKNADKNPTPEERTKEYYEKRPCPELAEMAANLVQKFIEEADGVKR